MKRRIFIRYCIALVLALMTYASASAQREKNNIYLFDCTGSMKTNGLWEPAKNTLDATITTQTAIPGSQFTIIPFGDNPYPAFTFTSAEYPGEKSDIEIAFNSNIAAAKYTHITDVLLAGFSKVDPNKDNKIYLLTDGMPNHGDTPEKVAQTIRDWCRNHRNCRLFYVALTNGVLNPVIKQAIDDCDDAFVVQCEDKVIPQIADISSDVYTNLAELDKEREIYFSLPSEYALNVNCADSLFDVMVRGNKASDCKILISLVPKRSIQELHQLLHGEEYEFPVSIQCKDNRFFIANPNVTVHVTDEVPSKLTIALGYDEIWTEEVNWYDSFLWSDAAPDQKVVWDLIPIFENQLANSSLKLRFDNREGKNDFRAWYNGKPIKNGEIITIAPGKNAILEVLFDHDAQTGKRYFDLIPAGYSALDMINDQPAENYEGTSLRGEYSTSWNPLKTLLFWLGIILLALLALWFILLKRIFFPTIKLSKIEFTGPGSYYASKRLKGARKVVLSSKRRSQNILSRIFTGEIRYLRAEHFSPALTITPSGGKKKVKLRPEGKSANTWDIYPSAIFGQYDKGTLTNRTTGDKSNIEFS